MMTLVTRCLRHNMGPGMGLSVPFRGMHPGFLARFP